MPGITDEYKEFVIRLAEETERRRDSLSHYMPHAGQLKAHMSSALTKIVFGGNRSGKSVWGVHEDFMALTGQHPIEGLYRQGTPKDPFKLSIMSKPYAMQMSIQPQLEKLFPPDTDIYRTTGKDFDKSWEVEGILRGKHFWSVVRFLSNNQAPEEMESVPQDLHHIDEACSYDQYMSCRMRLGSGLDYRMHFNFTLTPFELTNWMDGILYDIEGEGESAHAVPHNDDIDIFMFNLWDNAISNGGYISDEEVARAEEELKADPSRYDSMVKGMPALISRIVFPMFESSVHTFKAAGMEGWSGGYPKKGSLYVTMDPHNARPDFIQYWVVTPDERQWLVDEWPSYETEEFAGQIYKNIRHVPFTKKIMAEKIVSRCQFIGLPVEAMAIDPYFAAKSDDPRNIEDAIVDEFNKEIEKIAPGFPKFQKVHGHSENLSEIMWGVDQIRKGLYWDRERPIRDGNWPTINIASHCRNTIRMMQGLRFKQIKEKDGRTTTTNQIENVLKHAFDCRHYFDALHPKYIPRPERRSRAEHLERPVGWI